jgi:hypothetical protein
MGWVEPGWVWASIEAQDRADDAVRRFKRMEIEVHAAGSPTSLWWAALYEGHERARSALRHAVILEGANVDCRAVRDGGG